MALLVANFSRLACSSIHLESLNNGLRKADIRVVSAVGPFEVHGESLEYLADQAYLFVRDQRRVRRKLVA